MKKLFSIALAFTLVLGLVPVSAFAVETETSNVTKQQVSDVYGIPMSVLDTLDEDTYNSLSEQISDALNISSEDTYVKISYTESGDSIITESTYQDFLVSSLLSRVSGTDENSWLRIHTTIVDKGSYAQVSAAYTWLTNNIMAAYDIMGLAIVQGTFMRQTASGFRSYKDWRGVHSIDYVSSDFSDHGHGVTCTFQISANTENNFTFMKANIHKEGNSEGLNGTYAHQRIGINIEPEANIDRSGILSCIGFNIGEYYDQYSGYIDIAW